MTASQRAASLRGAVADVESAVVHRKMLAPTAGIPVPPTPTGVSDDWDDLDDVD